MKGLRIYIVLSVLIVLLSVGIILGRKAAREHVNYVTAVEDHPLNCVRCHLYTQKDNFMARMVNEVYVSPYNLAISHSGDRLYVVGQESDELVVVDPLSGKVLNKIGVGHRPHTVVVTRDDRYAFISNQWEDNIFRIDLASGRITDTLRAGGGPAGMVIDHDHGMLYVVNSSSSDLSVLNLETLREIRRLKTGNNPVSVDISPGGEQVYVTSRRSIKVPYQTSPVTEMTVADTRSQRVGERRMFRNAYIMENVEVTPSGDLAIATLIRPKNLIPAIQVGHGWMMTHGLGVVERREGGRVAQLLLDEPDAYFSDPFDVKISPDGKRAYVSHAGVDRISVVDLDALRQLLAESNEEDLRVYANHLGISNRYVIGRIPTGANPKGMVLSPGGETLYVAERLEDRIAVINTSSLVTEKTISLEGPSRITVARKGRQLLNNAGHTFQNQYACYTCHPDSHEDGLVYNMAARDMGRNLANVQTLRDIGDIPPYKWNGKNQTIYKQDGMRFSTVLTRTEAFTHRELDALVAYIMTGIKNPPNLRYNPEGELTAAQERGRAIYYRDVDNHGSEIPEGNRCYTCHPPPFFTNLQLADVGTLSDTDDPMKFDVPQLNNVYESAPYLHDGKAATLEEIWTKFNNDDLHGVANDMTKDQLNDLVEYLKSLRDAAFYAEEPGVYHASVNKRKRRK